MTAPKNELHALRIACGATQSNMANAAGMPLRTYQALEDNVNPVKPYHLKAARFAALELSVAAGGLFPSLPYELVDLVERLKAL